MAGCPSLDPAKELAGAALVALAHLGLPVPDSGALGGEAQSRNLPGQVGVKGSGGVERRRAIWPVSPWGRVPVTALCISTAIGPEALELGKGVGSEADAGGALQFDDGLSEPTLEAQ